MPGDFTDTEATPLLHVHRLGWSCTDKCGFFRPQAVEAGEYPSSCSGTEPLDNPGSSASLGLVGLSLKLRRRQREQEQCQSEGRDRPFAEALAPSKRDPTPGLFCCPLTHAVSSPAHRTAPSPHQAWEAFGNKLLQFSCRGTKRPLWSKGPIQVPSTSYPNQVGHQLLITPIHR